VELDACGVQLPALPFVLTSVLPDFLFHSERDPGHRPRLLLQGHDGAPGEHVLVRTGDLLDSLAIIIDNICVTSTKPVLCYGDTLNQMGIISDSNIQLNPNIWRL
jgi:hypothetical protein